jgi:hypothetical protein
VIAKLKTLSQSVLLYAQKFKNVLTNRGGVFSHHREIVYPIKACEKGGKELKKGTRKRAPHYGMPFEKRELNQNHSKKPLASLLVYCKNCSILC